jgi:hypothetical protein
MRALLLTIGVLAIGAGATGLSGAALTGERQEPASTFTGGLLDLTLTQEGASLLDATHLRPGTTRTETIQLRNAGNVPASSVAVAVGDHVDIPVAAGLSAVLDVELEDCGTDATCAAPAVAYTGTLQDFSTASLGGIAGGASRYVRLTVGWDIADADPARQGAAAGATIVWTAVAGDTA